MRLRNDRLATVLMVLGVVSVVGGLSAESSRSAASEPAPGSAASAASAVRVQTPVLSARRVPTYLAAPQAARRLQAKIAPILAGVPSTRCLVVSDGPTPLVVDQPDTPLPAASNQKIVTALAALDVLGRDATFTTEIAAESAPAGGVVSGDLWMIGGGDPIIDSDTYQAAQKYGRSDHTSIEAMADQIKAAGVTSITGSVKGDESAFDTLRTVPSWPDRYLRQNQVGPLSGLSVNDARTYPVIAGAPSGTPQPASAPAQYAADALTQLLVARGVSVAGPAGAGTAPAKRTVITSVESLPLTKIVAEMLTFSDNNTAELLLKQVGRATAKEGTTAAGLDAVRKVVGDKALPADGMVLVDGSGLDTTNRLTCRLLAAALTTDGPSGPIANGLAVADGEVGTLRDRYTKSPAAQRVRAKTGTLKSVTALSGWVKTMSDADVVFSFVITTGDRDVAESDLRAQQQVTEAILSYPDSIDPATLGPQPIAP